MKPQHPKYKVFQGKKTSSEATFQAHINADKVRAYYQNHVDYTSLIEELINCAQNIYLPCKLKLFPSKQAVNVSITK